MHVFFVFDKRQRKIDTKFFYIWKLFSLARFLFYLADVISILLSKMDSIFAPRFILWHQNAEEKVWICIFEMKGYIFRSARREGGTYALKVNYIFSAKCWTNNLHYFVKQELFQKKNNICLQFIMPISIEQVFLYYEKKHKLSWWSKYP